MAIGNTASGDPIVGRRARRAAWFVVAIISGVAFGIGAYAFVYAEGASYLSTDPTACVNCHIMRPQYDAWQKSSHHTVATCVDCHLPAAGVAKWIAKGRNGFNHSWAFTFQDFAEPIEVAPFNREILEANCLRCHGDLVHELLTAQVGESATPQCVRCHAAVGHGPRAGLGGADRGVEKESLNR
ncbi:MAG: cytochrome c nitrite reductase small subunit [Planctomycetota bacterium]